LAYKQTASITPVFDVAEDKRDIKAGGSCTPLLLTGTATGFAGT